MSRLTEKQLLILTIGITVLLSGGLAFLIWSDLQTIDEENGKIADLRQRIRSAETEIGLIPQREHRVIANREKSEQEVAFLPEEAEIETFWEVLERFATESGVRISEIAPNRGRSTGRGRGKGRASPIQSVPQIMSLRGTVEEFLRFINLIENNDRIINVVEYSLAHGDTADEDGKIRHSIKLALTTFTYSKTVANTIVSIPNYDKKKDNEEVKKWLGRIKIQEKLAYTLRSSLARRDPFLSVRRLARTSDVDVAPENRLAQEGMIEQLVELLGALRDGLDHEDVLRKRGDLWRLKAQQDENRDLFNDSAKLITEAETDITVPELQDRLQKEVLQPWAEVKERMDAAVGKNPPMTKEQVTEWHEKIKELFDERKWNDVQDKVRAFKDMTRGGQHVAEDAHELREQIFELAHKAKVIQGFEKRRIKISTILYAQENSVAVINSKQMQEGDALDAEGQVTILEIGENYVIFETEGVEIKRRQG